MKIKSENTTAPVESARAENRAQKQKTKREKKHVVSDSAAIPGPSKAAADTLAPKPAKSSRADKRTAKKDTPSANVSVAQSARLAHQVEVLENVVMGEHTAMPAGLTRRATAWLQSLAPHERADFTVDMQQLFGGLSPVDIKRVLDQAGAQGTARGTPSLQSIARCLHASVPVRVRLHLLARVEAGASTDGWIADTQKLVGGLPFSRSSHVEADEASYLNFLKSWERALPEQRQSLIQNCQSALAGSNCVSLAQLVPRLLPLSSSHQRAISAQARRLYQPAFEAESRLAIAQALIALPEGELAEGASAFSSLLDQQFPALASLQTIVETPAPERAVHAAALARANMTNWSNRLAIFDLMGVSLDGTGDAAPVDNESAMRRERLAAEAESVGKLAGRFTALPATQSIVQAADKWLRDPKSFAPSELATLDKHRRGDGQSRLDDALRVLTGATRAGDYSHAVAETPKTADVFALVWHAIATYAPEGIAPAQREGDQANMRMGLVTALADCIENDGHRVCGDGTRQRFVNLLGGYYDEVRAVHVTPAEKLSALAQALGQSIEGQGHEATPDQVEAFEKSARAEGRATFAGDATLLADFDKQLLEFMEVTF